MLEWLESELAERRQKSLYRSAMLATHGPPGLIQVDGRWLNNFGANDYLGLAWHPAVLAALPRTTNDDLVHESEASNLTSASALVGNQQRFGSGASPLVSGHTEDHAYLEQALARFEHTEAAILFSTGYAANVGTIAALASEGDLILSDELNHASLIDGCRLSRAKVIVYPHCNAEILAKQIQEHQGSSKRTFIVTDSLFSMDGDIAPLAEIVDIATEFKATVIVDEAHATGVFGKRGSGIVEEIGLIDQIPVRIGTFSKAIGCMGGFVVGSQTLIDYLRNCARTYIYSTAMPGAIARAARASVELMHTMQDERKRLRDRSYRFRGTVKQFGLRTRDGDSPIVPIYVGSPDLVLRLSKQLHEEGHFVPAIRPPTVPRDGSLLRISLSVVHSEEQIEKLLQSLVSILR
jgi:8-amino-7-oxononanoate synthase